MAKEVKNPRKPATKRASKEKKVEEITVNIRCTPDPNELIELKPENIIITEGTLDGEVSPDEPTEQKEEKVDERDFNKFNEYKIGENKFDMTKANDSEALEMYKMLNSDDLVVIKNDKKPEENKTKEETSTINPQEVIEEFTEATKKLDNIMISKNPEEILKKELERANEVARQLEKQIKEQESNYNTKTWNGVTDGWYDY